MFEFHLRWSLITFNLVNAHFLTCSLVLSPWALPARAKQVEDIFRFQDPYQHRVQSPLRGRLANNNGHFVYTQNIINLPRFVSRLRALAGASLVLAWHNSSKSSCDPRRLLPLLPEHQRVVTHRPLSVDRTHPWLRMCQLDKKAFFTTNY